MSTILLFCFFLQDTTQDAKPKENPRYSYKKEHDPDGIGKFYMGREIAQVMGHLGIEWLERPEREKEEAPTKLMAALKIQPGQSVADIGSGSGYFTFKLCKEVGEKGKVYAVDIQQEMLDFLEKKAKESKVANIVSVLGKEDDPKLPADTIDLILMVDVYHEFNYPYEMTAAMVKSLKTGGRIAFVEYRGEDAWVPIKEVHKMTERQVIKEMAEFPLMKHKGTLGVLPRQHIILFEKTAANSAEQPAKKPG